MGRIVPSGHRNGPRRRERVMGFTVLVLLVLFAGLVLGGIGMLIYVAGILCDFNDLWED